MILQCIEFLRARHKGAVFIFFVIVMGIAVWSLTIDLHHVHTWAERHIPFFWAFFAMLAVLVLIFFCRWFGKCGIRTEENYYDN